MDRHLFSDESKVDGFRFAGAVVDADDLHRLRREVMDWRVGTARRWHTSKEKPEARKRALRRLVRLRDSVDIVIVEHAKTHPEYVAREACVDALARWASDHEVTHWVLEQDAPVEYRDRQTIAMLMHTGEIHRMRYRHEAGPAEPLLWIADFAAWLWSKGGAYRDAIAPLVVHHEVVREPQNRGRRHAA
ncbi:hypothetical protein QQX09_07930 [Demequina sp. SYSU T00192]|uniref:Uncharacterized protein n=1 Tax=Demequina litoralis TaxID=3051660 RepID=A0ABT8G9G2_9MICO|nr:hypothetical protein [Demequina sp. SYSU T00192]MDN4475783.1 hypothetical protein [Demequina sp. SYSU T00192]